MKKFFTGAFVAALVLGLGIASANAAYMHTGLLKQGSKSAQVMSLQQTLNMSGFLVATVGAGSPGMETMTFGPATKKAVMAFQSAKGLTPVDGIVGLQTGTALSAMTGGSVSYPAGCTSTSGFSTTTGMSCSMTASYPVGCTSASGFSMTTGMSCAGGATVSLPAGCTSTAGYSTTTGASCSTGTIGGGSLSGNTGDITVSSYSSGLETQVGEGATNTKVLGFEVKADAGSDVSLSTVKVTFVNNGSGSKRFDRYANTVSIWNESGTKIGSASASDFSESSNVYSRSISVNTVVRADQKARFFVSIDAVSNIDSNDYLADNWLATLDSVRFSDASGAILTDNTPVTRNFNFTSLANANDLELKVNLSSSNMKASTVKASTTGSTNGVELLKFTLRAQGGMMNVDEIPVTFTTSGTSIAAVTGNVTLKIGNSSYSETISSATGSTTVIFNDLDLDIAADDVVTATVYADVNSFGTNASNFAQGTTIQAQIGSLSSFDVEDRNGDPVTSANSDITGSAVGEVMTLRSTGVNTVMGAASINYIAGQQGVYDNVQYTIPVSVTSFGNTLYVGQSAFLSSTVSATSTNAFAVTFQRNSAPTTDVVSGVTSSVNLSSTDSVIEGNGYRLDEGQTKHFTVTVNLYGGNTAGSYRVALKQIQTWTNAALSSGSAVSTLLPVEQYQTNYQLITK